VHEHCNSTSARDKYWVFADAVSAKRFFTEHTLAFKDSLWVEYYQEIAEEDDPDPVPVIRTCDDALRWIQSNDTPDTMDAYVALTDDDYLVLSEVDSRGFARRP
jgi:hypothetical protein